VTHCFLDAPYTSAPKASAICDSRSKRDSAPESRVANTTWRDDHDDSIATTTVTAVFWSEGDVNCVLVSDLGLDVVLQPAVAKRSRRPAGLSGATRRPPGH
jgi:hypothetical protein